MRNVCLHLQKKTIHLQKNCVSIGRFVVPFLHALTGSRASSELAWTFPRVGYLDYNVASMNLARWQDVLERRWKLLSSRFQKRVSSPATFCHVGEVQ